MGTADRINYANIGLMAIAAIAAFVLPFEVFLFSYAVLGPLHYLTEISWLHQRGYFTRRKGDYLALVAIGAVLLFVSFGLSKAMELAGWGSQYAASTAEKLARPWGFILVFMAFALALTMAFVKNSLHRVFAVIFAGVAALVMCRQEGSQLAIGVFLPTLVHVFLFTGAFLLFGALKSRSRSGILSFAAFVAVPILMWLFNDLGSGRILHPYVEKTYNLFRYLNMKTIDLLHLGTSNSREDIYYSSYGLLVMRFIAYAYTYHYLNWFSKTSVIGWHQVSKPRLAAVLALWLLAVGAYVYDYRTGFVALFCLSFLHVFLEFPLNHVTFVGIGRELRQIIKSRKFVHG